MSTEESAEVSNAGTATKNTRVLRSAGKIDHNIFEVAADSDHKLEETRRRKALLSKSGMANTGGTSSNSATVASPPTGTTAQILDINDLAQLLRSMQGNAATLHMWTCQSFRACSGMIVLNSLRNVKLVLMFMAGQIKIDTGIWNFVLAATHYSGTKPIKL